VPCETFDTLKPDKTLSAAGTITSWDWVLASLFALVLLTGIAFLAGIALWTAQPQTAAILDDATTGQSTRPSVRNLPD
jgi:predicted small integral membrane protein